jgi:exosome complex RNA-binding protein Rrp4
MAYKPGTLVRVKDSAWDNPEYFHVRTNRKMVEQNGYLWIVTEMEDNSVCVCRSVATGFNGAVWLNHEIEGAD